MLVDGVDIGGTADRPARRADGRCRRRRTRPRPRRPAVSGDSADDGGRSAATGLAERSVVARPRASRLDSSEQMFDACVLGVDPGVARLGLAVLAQRDRKIVAAVERNRPDRRATWTRPPACEPWPTARAPRSRNTTRRRSRSSGWPGAATRSARCTWPARPARSCWSPPRPASRSRSTRRTRSSRRSPAWATRTSGRCRTRSHGSTGCRDVPTQPDAADAVAVGLTHLLASRMRGIAARAGAR